MAHCGRCHPWCAGIHPRPQPLAHDSRPRVQEISKACLNVESALYAMSPCLHVVPSSTMASKIERQEVGADSFTDACAHAHGSPCVVVSVVLRVGAVRTSNVHIRGAPRTRSRVCSVGADGRQAGTWRQTRRWWDWSRASRASLDTRTRTPHTPHT